MIWLLGLLCLVLLVLWRRAVARNAGLQVRVYEAEGEASYVASRAWRRLAQAALLDNVRLRSRVKRLRRLHRREGKTNDD